MLKVVAGELNNTPAVCRRSYVHPAIVEHYLSGRLADEWTALSARRGSRELTTDERRFLGFLDAL
jgi:DNA topoisomerase-1